MLNKQNRLRHMKDWKILFDEGRFVGGEFVTLKFWKIDPEKYSRREYSVEDLKIGFAVGLKVHKGAVKRNRIKRQMREVIRLLLKENKIKTGYMVGILAKPNIFGKSYEEIEKEIIGVLSKSKLLM